jgi:diguanylate cyclase (GGDEF)-like protein
LWIWTSFKQVNDNYGHDAGDKVLVIIAARLRAAIRDTDEVARYGGDEFVLLIKDTRHAIDIDHMVDKISAVVEEPIALENAVVDVGASIGWASFPEDGDDYMRLIKIADSRMYNRKRDRKSQKFSWCKSRLPTREPCKKHRFLLRNGAFVFGAECLCTAQRLPWCSCRPEYA